MNPNPSEPDTQDALIVLVERRQRLVELKKTVDPAFADIVDKAIATAEAEIAALRKR